MELIDILPQESWGSLEKEVNSKFGVNACVFNKYGARITNYQKWANRLCPAVKGNDRGQTYICAVANRNAMMHAMRTKKPVIEECDAGLMKAVVPIFVGDEFLGVAGGCGVMLDDSEVESFLIKRITGIDEEDIESLSDDIHRITADGVQSLLQYVQEKVDSIVSNFAKEK
jgi:ligand-binding sensor protein